MNKIEFEGDGSDRASTQSYPVEEAKALTASLLAEGKEASWAPDCDDASRAWIYCAD